MSDSRALGLKARRFVASVALSLLAAACGTTVPGAEQLASAPGGSEDALALPSSTGSGPLVGGPAGTGNLRGTSGPLGSGSPLPTGSGAEGKALSRAPGIEGGFIKIGVVRTTNRAAAYAAVGASALAGSGYEEKMRTALVNHINRTGIHGLKIRLVPFDVDLSDQTTPGDQRQQQMCTKWTQDDRVFAVFAGEGEVLDACTAKARVLEVCGGCAVSTYDRRQMAQAPMLFEPNSVTVDRQVPFYVKGLVDSGFFKSTGATDRPKIGFLAFDTPTSRRQFGHLKGVLRSYGLSVAESGFFHSTDSAVAISQVQSYSLRFKSSDVNRVLVFDRSGTILGYVGQAADKNAWYPHWGLNSTSGPGILHAGDLVPPSQLPYMTVIGWIPFGDLDDITQAQRPPGLDNCLKIIKTQGVVPQNPTDYGLASYYCDEFLFLAEALRAAPTVSVDGFRVGASTLGTAFRPSTTYGATWTEATVARRDGASVYRPARYASECNCFRYIAGPQGM